MAPLFPTPGSGRRTQASRLRAPLINQPPTLLSELEGTHDGGGGPEDRQHWGHLTGLCPSLKSPCVLSPPSWGTGVTSHSPTYPPKMGSPQAFQLLR